MKTFTIVAALAGLVAAAPQPSAVTSDISPSSTDPAGCSSSYDGKFEISVVNASSSAKRSLSKRTALVLTLADGKLTDAEGRTGYIASNDQFQFDKPVQAGAIYTSGWSVCSNGTLALGDSAVFYECLSGTFYNLYDEDDAAQCSAVFIDIVADSSSTTTVAAESTDGQVTATPQSSAASTVACEITDGQIQQNTCTATASVAVVTQITDGQIQATTGVQVVSEITDGQIQATTGAQVVSEITDGQIQATTGTTTATSSVAVVTQITDGQIQATTGTTASASMTSTSNSTVSITSTSATSSSIYTGAATLPTAGLFGLAAGLLAVAAL